MDVNASEGYSVRDPVAEAGGLSHPPPPVCGQLPAEIPHPARIEAGSSLAIQPDALYCMPRVLSTCIVWLSDRRVILFAGGSQPT